MGIGTDGDQFTAQLTVTFQDACAGIWLTKAVFEPTGIDFQTFSVFNQVLQDGIQILGVCFVGIKLVLVGTVADHKIHVS